MGKSRSSNGLLGRKSCSIEAFSISMRRTSAPEELPLCPKLSKGLKHSYLVLRQRRVSMSLAACLLELVAVLACQLPSEVDLQHH